MHGMNLDTLFCLLQHNRKANRSKDAGGKKTWANTPASKEPEKQMSSQNDCVQRFSSLPKHCKYLTFHMVRIH